MPDVTQHLQSWRYLFSDAVKCSYSHYMYEDLRIETLIPKSQKSTNQSNKMAMVHYQALLLSTANSLTSASVVPSNPAFAPSIQSLITTVVSSSNLLFKTEYAKIYKLWQEQLMSMSVDDEENTTTINYLHAILLAMSALNDGTSATGEHMLIHVVMPLLNDEYHRSDANLR